MGWIILLLAGGGVWWFVARYRTPRLPAEKGQSDALRQPSRPVTAVPRLAEYTQDDDGQIPYGDGPIVRSSLHLFISYRGGSGVLSERKIVCEALRGCGESDVAVTAWCEGSRARRTFLCSRILECVDTASGEMIDPPDRLIRAEFERDPAVQAKRGRRAVEQAALLAAQAEQDALLVLAYVARSEGRMTAVEREVIAEFSRRRAATVGGAPLVDEQIKRLKCDHSEYLRAVRDLRDKDEALRVALIEAARNLSDADGERHEGEVRALSWLTRKLAPGAAPVSAESSDERPDCSEGA